MTRVVAIINQKGGVGKTTTAVTLAHGLALTGKKVLLIDLDTQGNVADALGLEKGPGVYKLLVDQAGRDAIIPSGRPNLDVVTSDHHTVQAKQILVGRPARERTLRRTIQTLTGYDAIVLDVAPSVDLLQVNALVAADVFIVPVALEYLAVVGASEALRSASSLAELGEPVGRCVGILPTFLELTTRESQEQLAALVELYQKKNILWFPIPKDTKAREAPAFGKTLWEHAPECRALAGIPVAGKLTGGYRQALSNLTQSLEH